MYLTAFLGNQITPYMKMPCYIQLQKLVFFAYISSVFSNY